jgi:hypothetical protein
MATINLAKILGATGRYVLLASVALLPLSAERIPSQYTLLMV